MAEGVGEVEVGVAVTVVVKRGQDGVANTVLVTVEAGVQPETVEVDGADVGNVELF